MRVAFAGTPEFARVALARLHAAGFDIPLVLSQPDRPAGRGMKLHPSPVKAYALEHGFPAESRGAISVALRREGDGLVALTVADDGHGLSPGFDLDATRSLGLRIVKALAVQLGGSFDMRSQLPGAGTICHIRFAG